MQSITLRSAASVFTLILVLCALASCASSDEQQSSVEPPPNIQAWMDRLTVEHEYDPATGFIVAREVITLPDVLADAPPLAEAIERSKRDNRPLIVFATADRCAPCQQYKKDALTNALVIIRLTDGPALATHIEVDREGESADRYLGGRAIPMTYLLRDGEVVATLRGQRSANDLLHWMNVHEL